MSEQQPDKRAAIYRALYAYAVALECGDHGMRMAALMALAKARCAA